MPMWSNAPHDGDVTCSASYRRKTIKNSLGVFERGGTLLQNGMLYTLYLS